MHIKRQAADVKAMHAPHDIDLKSKQSTKHNTCEVSQPALQHGKTGRACKSELIEPAELLCLSKYPNCLPYVLGPARHFCCLSGQHVCRSKLRCNTWAQLHRQQRQPQVQLTALLVLWLLLTAPAVMLHLCPLLRSCHPQPNASCNPYRPCSHVVPSCAGFLIQGHA